MAIEIKQKRNKMGFSGLITTIVLVGILLIAAYYMFFAPTPGFEVIVPSTLERTQTISSFNLDPDTVFNSPDFKALEKYKNPSTGGTFGRPNPFLAY